MNAVCLRIAHERIESALKFYFAVFEGTDQFGDALEQRRKIDEALQELRKLESKDNTNQKDKQK